MKAFSEEQKVAIKKSLMDSCLHCWGVYGFSKTSVSQLCEMVGISVGAFYKLFDSKEHLFYEASQEYEMGMLRELDVHLQKEPNKRGFVEGVKSIVRGAMNSVWFYQINIDTQKIIRKLNFDFEESSQNTINDIYVPFFEKYNLKLKKPIEEVVTIIALLFGGVLFKEVLPMDITSGIDFIVESTISALVE